MNKALELYHKYKSDFDFYKVNTKYRLACFFGQCEAEVGYSLKPTRESGYYKTIDGLRDTFYTPFKGKSDSFVKGYLRDSERLLNYVYANREGNGDVLSGDGYFLRGGGIFQISMRNNYRQLSIDTAIPFLTNPDLILDERNSIISALWYWNRRRLNDYADKLDIDSISDLINKGHVTKKYGDATHFEDRKLATEKYLKAFV